MMLKFKIEAIHKQKANKSGQTYNVIRLVDISDSDWVSEITLRLSDTELEKLSWLKIGELFILQNVEVHNLQIQAARGLMELAKIANVPSPKKKL